MLSTSLQATHKDPDPLKLTVFADMVDLNNEAPVYGVGWVWVCTDKGECQKVKRRRHRIDLPRCMPWFGHDGSFQAATQGQPPPHSQQ